MSPHTITTDTDITMASKMSQAGERGAMGNDDDDDDGDINLISTRKERSMAMKRESIKATKRSTVLCKSIKDKNWDRVLQHLDYHERDAKHWIEELNEDGTKRWRSLPIHLACERKPAFEVINQLVRIHPAGLESTNYGGDLPIHIACREGVDKDIIKLMLDKGPDTTKIPDCEGRLPLHLAASSSSIHVNSIQDLITYNEKALRTPDDFGLVPLHWACTKETSVAVVETIIKSYPYATETKDAYDRLPIDRIKTSKNPEKAKVIELLKRDPSSWTSAMSSTILELSSKLSAAEKMGKEYESKEGECQVLMEQNARSFNEINALTEEILRMREEFATRMRNLKKSHSFDLQAQEEEFSKRSTALRKAKEEAEKKAADLKILADELVEQLKVQKNLIDEKEKSRKELKAKAMGLVSRLEEAQTEMELKTADNENLKMQQLELKYEVEKRDQHIMNMTEKRKHGSGMYSSTHDPYDDVEYRSRASYEPSYVDDRDGRQSHRGEDPRDVFECVRIRDDNSY